MPAFIDRHPLNTVPPAVRHQIHIEAVHGLIDVSGARPLGHWVEDGNLYCILAAPDLDALCRHHAARGLPCDDVTEVPGIAAQWPLTAAEREVVRTTIARVWHAAHPESV